MTTTDPVWAHRTEAPPQVSHGQRRGALRTVRDVLACIRDVLLIIVLAAVLIFGGAVVKGLSDLGNTTSESPATQDVPTNPAGEPCIGEVPPPGC